MENCVSDRRSSTIYTSPHTTYVKILANENLSVPLTLQITLNYFTNFHSLYGTWNPSNSQMLQQGKTYLLVLY